ncbi:TetR/AcrR family transcriptional regulator [Sphingobium sp. SCG-1]|uniref:TetR/AcrR family transcriptional regulator n=1 Tax=Sphingobium sp. SCG-1 TaxID=2072936 RepID=UPI0021D52491|nr:TetR/AcrR family transcriptional regulator [Sphingobium sp. SCG-1]
MSAATSIIASEGLGAATAAIAKEAGVSNGSLFTYFPTKTDLLNQLYIELKREMAAAAVGNLRADGDIRQQMFQTWLDWLYWATSCPEKRRTLAHLDVSDDITEESRQAAHQMMAGVAQLLERSRATGPMCDVPLAFVTALMSALAETTIDFMIRDRANAEKHSVAAFDALWRILS